MITLYAVIWSVTIGILLICAGGVFLVALFQQPKPVRPREDFAREVHDGQIHR